MFGSYVEMHYDPNMTNNTALRNRQCIEIVPTGNIQGTRKVFFLNSGKCLKRVNSIPMVDTEQIIKKVVEWGKFHNYNIMGRGYRYKTGTIYVLAGKMRNYNNNRD